MFQFLLLAISGAGFVQYATALSFPFVSTGRKDQTSDNVFGFQSLLNVSDIYAVELTISGEKFLVQLDTGSSDLWLDTARVDLQKFQDTGVNSSITYLDTTSASGPVLIGNVTLGTFSANQAFISAPGSNATHNGDKGLLGIGPPDLSQIAKTLSQTTFDGSMLLKNIFDQSDLPEFFTVGLARSEETGSSNGGLFTIGEFAPGHSDVVNSEELDVIDPTRWTVFMDGMIVNGKNFSGNSVFQDVPGQAIAQTLADLDTGTSLSLIPKVYADAIYASIPGVLFSEEVGLYQVPYDAKINVSFVFGGQEYPVHPIDTVQAVSDGAGSVVCFSGFPVDLNPENTSQDFLLGDSFLRNVYAMFDFGTFLKETVSPNIKLQSTTDADAAYAEFDTLSAQRNQSIIHPPSPTPSDGVRKENGAISPFSSQSGHFGAWLMLLAVGAVSGAFAVC